MISLCNWMSALRRMPRGRQIPITAAVERELGSKAGDAILIRVEKASAIPLESLHGRKEAD
jgi:hypothetical protein